MRGMTSISAVLAIGTVMSTSAFANTCPSGDPRLVGHYALLGEMEVGSQLLLRPDGQFEFMLVYGATDQYGQGCWSVKDGKLALRVNGRRSIPAQHSPADRTFRGMFLTVDRDGRLGWPLPGFRGKFVRQ